MMKKIFCFMAVIIFSTVFPGFQLFGQKLKKTDRAEILRIMSNQESDWSKGDMEAYMQGYWKSDSLRFITKKGILYGWQNMLDRYKKSYLDKNAMGTLKFEIISIEALSKDKALVSGKWILTRTSDVLSGYFTLIWKKTDGKWVIVIDHTS